MFRILENYPEAAITISWSTYKFLHNYIVLHVCRILIYKNLYYSNAVSVWLVSMFSCVLVSTVYVKYMYILETNVIQQAVIISIYCIYFNVQKLE